MARNKRQPQEAGTAVEVEEIEILDEEQAPHGAGTAVHGPSEDAQHGDPEAFHTEG